MITAAGGAQFGYSTNRTPGVITGNQGQWTLPNSAGNRAGMILAINGFGADGSSVYYRRDGALPLTGAMNANNQDIQNAGNVSAKTLKLQGGNSLQIGSGATYYGDTVNVAVRTNGTLYVQNEQGAGSVLIMAGDVTSNGTVSGNTVDASVANINASASNCGWNGVTIRNNTIADPSALSGRCVCDTQNRSGLKTLHRPHRTIRLREAWSGIRSSPHRARISPSVSVRALKRSRCRRRWCRTLRQAPWKACAAGLSGNS